MKERSTEDSPRPNLWGIGSLRPSVPISQRFVAGRLTPWQAHLFAAGVTAVIFAVRFAFEGHLGGRPTMVFFTIPIVLSAYVGGLRPGLLATVLACFLASYLLFPPINSFYVASPEDRWQLFVLGLSGVVISALNEALHRARHRADLATREYQRAEQDRDRFFSLSQDVLCVLGFDGYFKDVNPAWEKTLGHAKAALLTTPFIDFIHPDDRAATLAEAEKVSGGKALIAFENRYRHADGSYRWFQWSVTPVIANAVMYGVARDITERKRTEKTVRESEEYFHFLHDMAEATRVMDDPADIMAVMVRMLGQHLRASRCAYADVEADGEHFTILHDYTDDCASTVGSYQLSRFGARAGTELQSGRTLIIRDVAAELLPVDGADMFSAIGIKAIITCPLVKEGGLRGMMAVHQTTPRDWTANEIAIVQDVVERCWAIIERGAAEEKIAREQARFRRLVDSNAQGVMFWNTSGAITKANDAFLRIVGYSREDLEAGRIGWAQMTPPEYAQRDRESLKQIAATGICPPLEKEYIRKDGTRVPVMMGAANFEDSPEEGVSFVLDITERKQAEAALRDSEQKLRKVMDGLGPNTFIGLTTVEGILIEANRPGLVAAGLRHEDVLGKPFDQTYWWSHSEAVRVQLRAAMARAAAGESCRYNVQLLVADGNLVWIDFCLYPVRDANGRVIYIVPSGNVIAERVRAEEALRQAGALQRAIFNSANFSSIATDEKGVIQIFNVGAERMLGYTAAEVMNKITPAEISDPQEVIARAEALSVELGTPIAPGFQALVFKASRGIEDIYELTYFRKDGSRFPAVVSVTALRDEQHAIIGYLLIGTDNTARKLAEEALLKSGALQRAIFESANFSCIATNEKGVIQIFSVGAERMLGYNAAEVMNKITVADFHDPQEVIERATALSLEFGVSIAPGFEAIAFKAARKIEDIYELTKVRKDGSRFPAIVSVTALRDARDRIIGYLLVGTDNTVRQQVEEERKAALRELNDVRSALDEHALVAITDPRGKITYVNDKFCNISQFSRGELIGQDHRIINSGYHTKHFIRSIWQTIGAGRVWKGELKNKAKDGSFYWLDTTIVPFLDEKGDPVQYVAIRSDITERKRFELTLQQTNRELEEARFTAEEANLAKSEFLSSMSHELRTPLNGIIGFTEFLIDEKPGPLKPKQKEYLGDVLASGRHLLQLINDVLDLAKIEAGKMELHLETFPIRKAVEEVTAVIQGFAHKKHIDVGIEIGEGLQAVTLDQQKFKQVLYNLLSNAVKFTDDGGAVEIHACRVDDFRFAVGVRDTGIGIKAEDIARLFTEFEQLDSGNSRRFEGTGLGLVLTKKIVEFQGGAISVESEPGKGSMFTVFLPLTAVEKVQS